MKINGMRADDLAGTGLITKQRYAIPLWASLLGLTLAGLARYTFAATRWAVRSWRLTVPAALAAYAYSRFGVHGVITLAAVAVAVAGGWHRRHPDSFDRHVTQHARGVWRWNLRYRRRWHPAMDGVGLARTTPERVVYVPRVKAVRSTPVVDTLHLRLLHGHTPDDVAARAEGLRHVFGAHRCKVVETAPGRIRLVFYARDPLTATVPPITTVDVPDLAALPVGRAEDGDPYAVRLLGRHILIAGASGAGKGSVLWSILHALGPAIRAGSVRLLGIDPKRMELVFGRELFTRLEDHEPAAMAELLESAVTDMQARADRLAGDTRQHVPTTEDPAVVIVIDELATLTAYCPDRDIKRRVHAALSLLLSQGRAVGYYVIAALQDPRKDVVAFRDLFTVRIALRTTEAEHADMVLGDGALDRGAATHKIPDHLPGVGYVLSEGANEPVRVRFTYLDDTAVRAVATRYRPGAPTDPGSAPRVIDLREPPADGPRIPRPRTRLTHERED
jgi:S-DNA-T family DNA segregation ATPase FtsK/SpoIIIE